MQLSRLAKPLGFVAIAALPAGSNLLMTLVLVRGLGIEAFGLWALIEPLLLIFGTVGALGIQYGVLFTTASQASDPRRNLSAAFVVALPVSFGLASVAWLLARDWLPGVGYANLVLPLVAETLALLIISSLRGQRRLGAWITFEAIRSLGLVLVAGLALQLGLAWVRSINELLVLRGVFTVSAVLFVALRLGVRPVWDRTLVWRMVRYGLPIAGSALVGMLTSSGDRFLLATFQTDLSVVASYAAHQRLTGILAVLTVTPLNLWFAVEAMRRDTAAEAQFFQGVVSLLLIALSLLLLVTFAATPLLWPYLFPGLEFHPAVFFVLTIAIVPQTLAIVLNIGGLREKKTHLNALIVACGSAALLLVGIPLVQMIAATGAAIARLAVFVTNATIARLVSQRIAPVPHSVRRMVPVLAAIALASASLFHAELGLPVWVLPLLSLGLALWGLKREAAVLAVLLGLKQKAAVDRVAAARP
ncbi:lipopolysaccharide biosynthesis protein [Aureimonas jatrophae]|uniref:Membrane protein involved in the export of O-antigen and teichoic acid n=1 Tax=Aureimonas jatrophae TaxID=1166073 RepID=A0A1H0ND90_9HYPH|nr:hypothetical protein [Aureimonas jatrophae]MBB3951171.1 O-antigen/teichoic acid export membrane protein [Aureimonas jatrophae]SDO90613.1 Membrane protein involved in the export of O-antigen and teichoic acid [Aureimonas jatrophae]